MEQAVAVTALLADPRRSDGTATMALLSVANDVESVERLVGVAQEQAYGRGRSRLIGPTALSPHLGYGVLLDHFDKTPPLHTPYNPPYLPEVMDAVFDRVQMARLYHLAMRHQAAKVVGPATLRPLVAADDVKVLPYLLTALDDNHEFPRPDAAEAAFLLDWWDVAPRCGWIAEIEGQAVGFVLLQPDLAMALRQTKGARMMWWQLWWQWRRTWRTSSGRLVAGGVLPRWRHQGIGRQLFAAAHNSALQQGWRSLTIGPVADDSTAATFLRGQEAQPLQRYALYGTD
jgi:GNAT superfamily N-acetyltransferase